MADAPTVTVFVTVIPDPVTITITDFITEPPVTVLVPVPNAAPQPTPTVSSEGIDVSIGSAVPPYIITSFSTLTSSSQPSTTRTQTTTPLTAPLNASSTSHILSGQPSPSTTLPTNTTSEAPIPESAVPSVIGTARTYLGLAPNAFLGVILAIVLSFVILLCCLLCFLYRRRRKRRKGQEGYPPTAEQGSRLLAGDRDPTREDLVYPYSEPGREYRRSQIAVMHARGELDDDWEDRVHSPSIRAASLRLPEDENTHGAPYGIRERAFAAAGVRPPYGYTPVPKEAPSIRSGMRSIGSTGNSTVVPTVTPTTAGMTTTVVATPKVTDSETRASPTPRKDTQSTQATNDSSAIHMYATGGRNRMDSSEGAEQLFYQQTEEGEPPSAMASSSDLHFLQRYSTQAAASAAAGALASRQRSEGNESAQSSSGSGETGSANRTRNLDDVPRAAIAYPESPVSDSQENSQLMSEGEGDPSIMVPNDAPSRSQSRSTRESGLSRWIHDRNGRSTRTSQQQPILQRVLNRVMGNRSSTQPSFAIIPPSPARTQHPSSFDQQYRDNAPSRSSNGDFEVGNGLRFPRPPVHTGYSSGGSTARDDMRVWGGILPSRWSFGASSRTPRGSADVGASPAPGEHASSMSRMEESSASGSRLLGVPITASRDTLRQMRERPPTPGALPLLGLGLRPPPPSAFPPERRASGVSSGRSTVYYDARSATSTPMQHLNSNHDRAASPLSRYDSPPPQPITALRSAQSAQSFESAHTAPLLPPGLYGSADDEDDEDVDDLDDPPPMPTRDVRQARSLHTIHSVGTAETYGTTNSPLSLRRAYRQEEQTRLPSQGRDPAPRIAHSVPSDITPSESADADLGAGHGSFGQSSSVWNQGHNVNEHGEIDVLEEEPPTAASQWRVLSAYPQSDTGSGRGTGRSLRDLAQRTDWRLTLGQPVALLDSQEEPLRYSQFGDIPSEDSSQPGSRGSRGSSNQTNASHSRDIHSLRASEVGGTGGSNGSKDTTRTGPSYKSVSEYGHLKIPGSLHGVEGDALLSAFGPGPSRGGETYDSTGRISNLAPSSLSLGRRGASEGQQASQPPARATTPQSASADLSTTPGLRLVGSSGTAGTSGQGPFSAPVLPSRGWPLQAVPMDVTAEDGRRPSHLYQESLLHTHSHSQSSDIHDVSHPGTSDSHSHTHGTHGAETTMGTMTEATTDDHHDTLPEMPLSDVEHILPSTSPRVAEEEEGKQQVLEARETPPMPGQWLETPR